MTDWRKREGQKELFDNIKHAILEKRQLVITYLGGSGQKTIRTVEPFKLVFKKRDWYLHAYCCLKEEWRFFKLSRIRNYHLTTETMKQKNVLDCIDSSDQVAHQIKVLQAQLKELQTSPNAVVQVDVPQMQRVAPVLSMQPSPSLLTMNDSLKGKWVGEAPTIAVVPFDFERSVFFPLSSSRLGNDAQQKLAETLQFLSDFPQENIVLRGYASPEGNRKFNLRLAQKRQQAVQTYLVQHGVAPSRIILSDCGINYSDLAAQVVRRVDISLQK